MHEVVFNAVIKSWNFFNMFNLLANAISHGYEYSYALVTPQMFIFTILFILDQTLKFLNDFINNHRACLNFITIDDYQRNFICLFHLSDVLCWN